MGSEMCIRDRLRAIGRGDLIQDPRFTYLAQRAENIETLQSYLAEGLTQYTTTEAFQLLDDADLPNGPVITLDEMMDDPYLEDTNFFPIIEDPKEGPLHTTAIPVEFSKTPGTLRNSAPPLGEHTAELLLEVGFSKEEIDQLLENRSTG